MAGKTAMIERTHSQRLFTLLLLALGTGACSPSANVAITTPVLPSITTAIVQPTLTLSPTATQTASATETVTLPRASSIAAPSSTPKSGAPPNVIPSVVIPPTRMPSPATAAAKATALSSAGWKTFVSAAWQIAIDYPADWTVREQGIDVIFTSPDGRSIRLGPQAAQEDDLPNMRCTESANGYGVRVNLCLDTISGVYIANLDVTLPNGTHSFLALSARRPDLQIFNAMLASVRATQ